MFATRHPAYAPRLSILLATALLTGCGGCSTCNAPPYVAETGPGATPAPGTTTPPAGVLPGHTPLPGSTPTPKPGATATPTPTPTPTPKPTPTPTPTPTPMALTCAQNAGPGRLGVPLGSDATFAILGSSTVTSTSTTLDPTVVTGSIGLYPGVSVTGFPPGIETGGSMFVHDPVALQAQQDATIAYNNAALRTNPTILTNGTIGGNTYPAGVYKATSTLGLTGTVTLDGRNNPNSVFIFQVGTALTTAPNSAVVLINGAQACDVFWQVGSSATIGTSATFDGIILSFVSITVQHDATVNGRLLARTAAVSLDTNSVTQPAP